MAEEEQVLSFSSLCHQDEAKGLWVLFGLVCFALLFLILAE